jgi:NAD(P)H-flavin reductase
LTCPPKDGSWKEGVGRINAECLKLNFGSMKARKTMVLVCGPLGMCNVVKEWCKDEGTDVEKDLVIF